MNSHYERVKEGQWAYCSDLGYCSKMAGSAVIFRKGSPADPYSPGRKTGEDPDTGEVVGVSEWATIDEPALEFILDAANEKEART